MSDFKISITDQDALDAIAAEFTLPRAFPSRKQGMTDEQHLSDWITRKLIEVRGAQVRDDASKAFEDRQAAKAKAIEDAGTAEAQPAQVQP